MRESTIERAVCQYAKQKGVSNLKLSGPNDKGKADRLFMRRGVAAFIEFKAPGEVPTPLQQKFLNERTADGFAACYCDNVAMGRRQIDSIFP